jgi:hypothetical protein
VTRETIRGLYVTKRDTRDNFVDVTDANDNGDNEVGLTKGIGSMSQLWW